MSLNSFSDIGRAKKTAVPVINHGVISYFLNKKSDLRKDNKTLLQK